MSYSYWILLVVAVAVNAVVMDGPYLVRGAIFGAAVSGFYILGQRDSR